ncbi:MAG: VOC family protein [Acidimicrobiia bacterium]|nr:VOC family protein [Acidimicrobiia bacterium]
MIRQIREISIAVDNLDEAIAEFRQKLGLKEEEVQVEERPPIQSRFASFRVGDCSIALMESTAPGSPIDRFIARRGEGVFSVTLLVDDIQQASEHLKSNGVDLVLDEPLKLENIRAVDKVYRECTVNFTKPSGLRGAVFEIQELRD